MGAVSVFLVAGEPSGDKLGAALMEGLTTLRPDLSFAGVGGPLMGARGLTSLFPMDELSVMGLVEILPRYPQLRRRLHQTAKACLASGSRVLITIDSPDFSLRVAALVRRADPGIRTIHYVAPSVWAWRPGRARRMARVIDHVMALLPFEPPYMTAAGMTCDFVGHPVVADPLASPAERAAFDSPDGPLILALPGSRRSEIARLAPVFGQTLALVKLAHPKARVVLPTLPHLVAAVGEATADWALRPEIVTAPHARRGAFGAADVALAASGTVSLELAANRCPMVIAYDLNRLTLWLMRRMARIDTVTLVNLVSDSRVVPEFIGPDCRPDLIAPALLSVLKDPSAQGAAMDLTMDRLGRGAEAPGLRAARSVLAQL